MKFERWNKTKLEEIVEINPRTSLKKGTVAKKIAMEHVKEFTRKISGFEVTEFKSGSKFINNDTLMARITPCLENGKTAYVDILEDDEVAFGSTEFFVLRSKEGKSDSKFIYYLSISEEFRKVAIQSMTGTSGRQRAQKDSLLNYELSVPSLKEQKKIGKILSLYDEKVESNNAIISNLEELAQTLFKHWFVDFEFPNEEGKPYTSSGGKMVESELGMIPEGWEVETLDCLLELKKDSLKKGKHNDHKKYVPIDLLPMKQMTFTNYYPGTEAKSSLIEFKENDILLGAMRVYFHRVCLAPYDGITRTTCFVLRARENIYRYYALLKVFQDETINYANSTSKGTTIPYATWENGLSKLNVVVPTYDVLDRFNGIAAPIFLKLKSLSNQSQNLGKLRDTLLPKLLSGEIELPDDMEVTDDVPIS